MNSVERKRKQLEQLFRSFIMQWRAIQKVSWGCGNWEGNVVWNCATSFTRSLTLQFHKSLMKTLRSMLLCYLLIADFAEKEFVSFVPFSVEHSIWWREYQRPHNCQKDFCDLIMESTAEEEAAGMIWVLSVSVRHKPIQVVPNLWEIIVQYNLLSRIPFFSLCSRVV